MPCQHPLPRLQDHVVADSICTADAAGARAARYPAYRAGLDWLRDFITQPHDGLNRPGAVCPFVGPALQRGLVTFAIGRAEGCEARDAFAAMAPLREVFAAMGPTEAPARALRSLVVFFPDLPAERAGGFIDGGHRLLKPHFIEAGQMIGEFHPASTVPGSTNPGFHPMRAPVPAFVIREMSFHDTRFIALPDEDPARRAQYLARFLDYLGPALPARHRAQAEALLAAARAELAAI